MLFWSIIIFAGLWVVFRDLSPTTQHWFLKHPMAVHAIVIGSGLMIHGGSANGSMAAITSGVISALFMRWARWRYNYRR